jgi:methylglutaconyl-CoA hydratase
MNRDFIHNDYQYEHINILKYGSYAKLELNRPDVHNALHPKLIWECTHALSHLMQDKILRVLIISGKGKHFCSGADLEWLKNSIDRNEDENVRDSEELAHLFKMIYHFPKPTIAQVHGCTMGGGTGLIAACDIAIASRSSIFAFSEVRLGLMPSTISPYVVDAIGWRQARRYFLTGERFDAEKACEIGLIHQLSDDVLLHDTTMGFVETLLAGGPYAQTQIKSLLQRVRSTHPSDRILVDDTVQRLAHIRVGEEAQQGLSAFFKKQKAPWVQQPVLKKDT